MYTNASKIDYDTFKLNKNIQNILCFLSSGGHFRACMYDTSYLLLNILHL